jgi:IS4 transposase
MAFAQLTWRESLRDIEVCLSANQTKLFHMGIKGVPARSTLSDALNLRDWRIYHELAMHLIQRARSMDARRVYSVPTQRDSGVICDQTIALNGFYVSKDYPAHLRRIRFKDPESAKTLVLLINNTSLLTLSIAALYKNRWQVELFFKWIKQHLRIKRFLGTSENAVKTQIWCAVSTYVLIAIVKKELHLHASLYTLL